MNFVTPWADIQKCMKLTTNGVTILSDARGKFIEWGPSKYLHDVIYFS